MIDAEADQPAHLRFLVVDDNSDSADTLATVLQLIGAEAYCAYSGDAALQCFAQRHPDVVVLDLGMPGKDGFTTCEQVRAQPGGHDAVVIALSGWGGVSDRARSAVAGFDAHLVKPVRVSDLFARVEQARRSRRGAHRSSELE
ncbi:MAG: response regulator [Gemmatimonadota bacterium]